MVCSPYRYCSSVHATCHTDLKTSELDNRYNVMRYKLLHSSPSIFPIQCSTCSSQSSFLILNIKSSPLSRYCRVLMYSKRSTQKDRVARKSCLLPSFIPKIVPKMLIKLVLIYAKNCRFNFYPFRFYTVSYFTTKLKSNIFYQLFTKVGQSL